MIVKNYKNKTVLKGMSLEEIAGWCENQNHSPFRAKQIYRWMYRHGVENARDMTNISKKLQEAIQSECVLNTLTVEKIDKSAKEPTQKILFKRFKDYFLVLFREGREIKLC